MQEFSILHKNHVMKKPVQGVSEKVRLKGLKFQIHKVDGLYYLFSKKKVLISCRAADQLLGS